LKFMVKAAEYGLGVSKPWGDSSRYDFGVEGGGGLVRGAGEVDDVPGQGIVCVCGASEFVYGESVQVGRL
jgi:hypothetical protein